MMRSLAPTCWDRKSGFPVPGVVDSWIQLKSPVIGRVLSSTGCPPARGPGAWLLTLTESSREEVSGLD
jgi:hypothetical protein